jgi:hypothetical protein
MGGHSTINGFKSSETPVEAAQCGRCSSRTRYCRECRMGGAPAERSGLGPLVPTRVGGSPQKNEGACRVF